MIYEREMGEREKKKRQKRESINMKEEGEMENIGGS